MFGVLSAAALGGRPAYSAATPDKPNILFIYTDDHSYRTLSCYPEAYKWVRTPNIDKLAKRGVRFSAAYNGAWCMPSRAILLTGRHQFAIESMRMEGPYPGSTYDPGKCPFWPKVFREKGYVTAQIGKWHTGTDTGYGRDWDYQIVWNRPKYTDTSANYYYNQPLTHNGGKTEVLKRYSTDQYTDWAVDFMKGTGRRASISTHQPISSRHGLASPIGRRRSRHGRRDPMGRRWPEADLCGRGCSSITRECLRSMKRWAG
jgi:arylsulfatase A-like enzyme